MMGSGEICVTANGGSASNKYAPAWMSMDKYHDHMKNDYVRESAITKYPTHEVCEAP
jgi:hypothetical protein